MYQLLDGRTRTLETIAAKNRLIATGLERHFRCLATVAAGNAVQFARTASTIIEIACALRSAQVTTVGAPIRFILKTFRGKKLLFASAKDKFSGTISAGQHFIGVQFGVSLQFGREHRYTMYREW